LVVRRIPDLNPHEDPAKATLFDIWRFHAFFTTSELDTITADTTHRHHAIIEQVHADLKNSALAHLPSSRFAANGAWLVLATMAFNLTRAVATITGSSLAKATTATIRRTLITVPARIASSARRLIVHLPSAWPWASSMRRSSPALTSCMRIRAEWKVNCSRATSARPRRRSGISVSIVVFELGTMRPTR